MHAPWSPNYVISLVYDEFDLTAMALRGLNAERGRQAGNLSSALRLIVLETLQARVGEHPAAESDH